MERAGPVRTATAVPASYSARIDVLRVVLILGIVLMHIPPPLSAVPAESLGPGWFGFVRALLSGVLFLGAVPTLSVISGYLFFVAPRREAYWTTLRTKTRRLLIPLVLWNLPFVLILMAAVQWGGTDHAFRLDLSGGSPADLLDAVLALRQAPINPPLYFLRDLFVCFALTPVLRLALERAPWIALAAITALAVAPFETGLFLRADILLSFYVGALVAVERIPLDGLERLGAWPLLGYLGLCSAIAVAAVMGQDVFPARWVSTAFGTVRLLGPIAFWGLAAWIVPRTHRGRWRWASARSYIIFLGHAPLMMLLWLAMRPVGVGFYFVAPVLAVGILIVIHGVMDRWMSRALDVALGR